MFINQFMKKSFPLFILLLCANFIFAQNNATNGLKPIVCKPIYFDITPPMRDMMSLPPSPGDHSWKDGVVKNFFNIKKNTTSPVHNVPDPGVQYLPGQVLVDTTIQNFQGITNPNGYYPPDTHGDVSANYYFQVVNASYKIFNKTGTGLYGPVNNSTMWTGFANNSNDGDAIVLYDEQADRWLFSQFSLPNYPNGGPFYQMIAVSATNDPTGSWYRWQYQFTDMPDYPKFGVWTDGYYMSMNRFAIPSGNYLGTGAVAYDRAAMIAGNSTATMVLFTLPSSNEAFGLLPADCDGTFPTSGTPEYFVYINDNPDRLGILEFHVNWTTPSSSTFGNLSTLTVNSFTTTGLNGVPQQGTTRKLDDLSDRLMYRLQFRYFSDHWSMVTNHTVNANVSGANNAGIRWYELRKTTGAWSIYQQSTYAPDNKFRWMASAAMDTSGNIALGYSISSSTMYPSIRYCGRLKNDALNTMSIAERGIINGTGSQTGTALRWGDYSALSVDPSAPATFWYTTEYYITTSQTNWTTRIASFSFSTSMYVTATAVPSIINIGQQTQLDVSVVNGTPPYTYSWTSIPAGFTSNIKNPVASPVINTKYVVQVTSGAQTKTDTADVTVNLNVVATATPPNINAGQSSQLNAVATGATGSYTYSWTSIPAGFTSNIQNPVVSPVINTKYIIHVVSGSQSMNDTAQVDVTFSVVATATPSSITVGQTSQLDANPSGGSGTYTYLWSSIPAGYTSTLKNPVVSPIVTTQYIIQCNDGVQTKSDTVTVTVTMNQLIADATANPSSICAGQTSQLNVIATGGSTSYTYSWTSIPPGYNSNIQNPVVQPVQTTKYIAHVNDGFSTVTDTVQVDVTPQPTAYAGIDTTYCTYVTQIPLQGLATYYSSVLWTTSGDGTFSSTTSLTSTYYPGSGDKNNGSVSLTLTTFPQSPCVDAVSDSRHIIFDPCTGTQETGSAIFSVNLSPNPCGGIFLITINGVKYKDLKISVTDMDGKTIINTSLRSTQNTFVKKLDISQSPKGVYLVKVQTDDQVKTEKLIVR
jgi:hypothetical protein